MYWANYPLAPTLQQQLTWAQSNYSNIQTVGTNVTPEPPRNVRCVSGSRKVTVFWDLPQQYEGIVGWRVYKDTENNLYTSINDIGVRRCDIAADAAASSTPINVFVSSVNAAGKESRKVQTQGAAANESGAPTDTATPTDWSSSATGGGVVARTVFTRSTDGKYAQ